jgi:hypothetical protein
MGENSKLNNLDSSINVNSRYVESKLPDDSKVNLSNLLKKRAKEKDLEKRNNILILVGASAVGVAVLAALSL